MMEPAIGAMFRIAGGIVPGAELLGWSGGTDDRSSLSRKYTHGMHLYVFLAYVFAQMSPETVDLTEPELAASNLDGGDRR